MKPAPRARTVVVAKRGAWPVQEARANFSRLLDDAAAGQAQRISRRGKVVAVLVPIDDFERITAPQGSLLDFLRSSPLTRFTGPELDRIFARDRSQLVSPIEFE